MMPWGWTNLSCICPVLILLTFLDLAAVVLDFFWEVSSSLLGAWVFDTTGVVCFWCWILVGWPAWFTFFRLACLNAHSIDYLFSDLHWALVR